MTVRVAFMRHGRTDWNLEHRIQGRTDRPLTSDTAKHLKLLRLPAPWSRARLWSSPLSRAFDTARHVADLTPETTPALLEMDWGDWEGQKGTVLRADPTSGFRDITEWGWAYRPPGGETPRDVGNRLLPWLATLTGDNVVVSHIGIMRVALATAWGWPFTGTCPFTIKRNRLYVITKVGAVWKPIPEPIRLLEMPQ